MLEPLAALMVILALVLLAVRSDSAQQRRGLAIAGLALSGLVLNLLLIAAGFDDLITRNVIALWLPAAITVAAGLGAHRAGLLGVGGTVVLCATGILATVGVATTRNLQRPDWRAVAHVLGARPQAGGAGNGLVGVPERAILVQHFRDLLPLSLYLPGLRFMRSDGATVRELDVVSISAPRVHLCWWGAACNLSGTRIQSAYAIPGIHELWRRRALQFAIVRLISSSPMRLTPRSVSRALTTTKLDRDELLVQR